MAIKPKKAATAASSTATKATAAKPATLSSAAKAKAPAAKKATAPKRAASSKANGAAAATRITDEDIAFRAWEIWKNEGCPCGKEAEHWFQAKEELCTRS